jgi:hypothetical protein
MTSYPWGHQRRFNSFPEYIRKVFGERVQKLTINAGFTCPNRDGSIGYGGCTYCNNNAFNPSYCTVSKSVKQQISEGIEFHRKRYKTAGRYLAYFQAYSNTYAPLDDLKRLFEDTLKMPGIAGLAIGTRPDCMDRAKLDYLRQLSKNHYISMEYGIESCYNKTLEKVNRGHTYEQTKDMIEATAAAGLHVGGHLIFGLPGETTEEMLAQAEIISGLPLTTIKFHQLQILKNTPMATDYKANPEAYRLFGYEEYIDFIIKFLERLHPCFVIERLTGEAPLRFLLSRTFGGKRSFQQKQKIEDEMKARDTWQGRCYVGQ